MNLASILAAFVALRWPKQTGIILLSFLTVAGLDYATGAEVSFSFFYLIPVGLAAWLGRRRGFALSLVAAAVWWYVDKLNGHIYSAESIVFWNAFVRFGFFVVVSVLTSALARALKREQTHARFDALTGALNSRSFGLALTRELERSERYPKPFTLAYLDLDNFKTVNDTLGHAKGDEVLQRVVAVLRSTLRKVDVVARLGGDEFALLLPETSLAAAEVTLDKVRRTLLSEMRSQGWPVSVSIGAVSCGRDFPEAETLLKQADALMYEVKHGGKDGLKLEVFGSGVNPDVDSSAQPKAPAPAFARPEQPLSQ